MGKQAKVEGERAERAQVWAERIEGWRNSGQTQVEYCANYGLSVWLLRKWIVNLGTGRAQRKRRPVMLPIRLHPAGVPAMPVVAPIGEAALEIALPNGTLIRACGTIANELSRTIARSLRC